MRVPRGRRGNLEHGPAQGLADQQAAARFRQWLEVSSPHNHILYIGYRSIGHGIVLVLFTWFQDVRAIARRPCYIAEIWLSTTPRAGRLVQGWTAFDYLASVETRSVDAVETAR